MSGLTARSGAWCTQYANTLLGQQATDGSVDFKQQIPNRLIDSQVVRPLERRNVPLQIRLGLLQFQTHELRLISKGCPCFLLIGGRIFFDRDGELRLQAFNLQPCAKEVVVCPV